MNMEKNKYYEVFEDDCDNNKKLKLTKKNADFIEAVLAIDSNYKDANDPNKIPSKEYIDYLKRNENKPDDKISNKENESEDRPNDKIHKYGSSKYWVNKLVHYITNYDNINHEIKEDNLEYEKKSNNMEEKDKEKYSLDLKTIIKGTVYAIDRENSTHLNARGNGRNNVSEIIYSYIKEKGTKGFKDILLKQDDFSLIGLITLPKEKGKENYHYSFATKFCKYVSLGFDKDIDKYDIDKYYIYDNIVINNIDYYIAKYGLDNKKYNKKELEFDKNKINSKTSKEEYEEIAEKYGKLHKCLDEIREKAKINAKDEKELSRDEIDHIIWYFNK